MISSVVCSARIKKLPSTYLADVYDQFSKIPHKKESPRDDLIQRIRDDFQGYFTDQHTAERGGRYIDRIEESLQAYKEQIASKDNATQSSNS